MNRISPSGTLREWLRFNLRVFLYIGLPLLVLCPVITFLMGSLLGWTITLVEILKNIPKVLLGFVALMTCLWIIKRVIFSK